jgi:hypothetical protein
MERKGDRPWGSWFLLHYAAIRDTLEAFFHMRLGWLLPMVILLFLIGFVLAILGSAGPLAPFVYPLL